jgi:hypothetical protein
MLFFENTILPLQPKHNYKKKKPSCNYILAPKLSLKKIESKDNKIITL